MTFHYFKEDGMIIDFVKCFRQVDGTKISRATTCDITFNNIAACTDCKATSKPLLNPSWLSVDER